MTKREYMDMIERGAVQYVKDAKESVLRNTHMNELDGTENIPQKVIDAILVDFINALGLYQGLDEGYYVKDLYDERVK